MDIPNIGEIRFIAEEGYGISRKMCKGVMKTTKSYRAEEGERGDGREPPQARNGWRVRSEAVVYWRPPEGAKRPKGCVCGISPEAEGVRTQSRRHLNAVKVKTGRGKGAERPARCKLHIDRGGMGGGGSISSSKKDLSFYDREGDKTWPYDDYGEFYSDPNYFSTARNGIFHYCIYAKSVYDPSDGSKGEGIAYPSDDRLLIGKGEIDSVTREATCFMHELGHNILGILDASHHSTASGDKYKTYHCNQDKCTMDWQGVDNDGDNVVGYCSYCWAEIERDGLKI